MESSTQDDMPVERLLEAEIAVDPASFPSNHTSGGGPSGSGFLSGQSHGVNAGDQIRLTMLCKSHQAHLIIVGVLRHRIGCGVMALC